MKQITVPAIKLLIISAVCAFLLGICSEVTKEPIAAQTKRTQDEAMMAVLPEAEEFQEGDASTLTGTLSSINIGYKGGEICGYVLGAAPNGFSGAVNIMVGIDTEGAITGLRILSHGETPGLGARATEPEFYEQFNGKSGTLAVNKDGGDIVAITSATITSRAVTSGANEALQWFNENGGAQ